MEWVNDMTIPDQQQLHDQLIAAQETLMHQQNDLQQMHEVLLTQQNEIDELRKAIEQLRSDMETGPEENRFPTPEEDKPPHY